MEEKKKENETSNFLLPTSDEIEGVSLEGTVSFFPLSYKVLCQYSHYFRLVVLFSVLIVSTSKMTVQINLANTKQ